jgi:hypothetical protein
MRNYFYLILLLTGLASACNKSVTALPAPVASFTLDGDTTSTVSFGTYDGYSLINNSTNVDSCRWDFGNDSTYTSNEVWLSYPRSGNYTLTLTVYNAGGKKSVMTKHISVYDRVIRSVVITSLDMNLGGLFQSWGYPSFGKVNAWVGIQQAVAGQSYTVQGDGTFNAPFVYKTGVQQNVDSTSVPVTFPVPGKLILDIPTLNMLNSGLGYGFNLYVQSGGSTYTLNSTYWAQSGYSFSTTAYNASNTLNLTNMSFKLRTGGAGVEVDFLGDYEQ